MNLIFLVYLSLCGTVAPTEVKGDYASCEQGKAAIMYRAQSSQLPAAIACKVDGVTGFADFTVLSKERERRKLPFSLPTGCV